MRRHPTVTKHRLLCCQRRVPWLWERCVYCSDTENEQVNWCVLKHFFLCQAILKSTPQGANNVKSTKFRGWCRNNCFDHWLIWEYILRSCCFIAWWRMQRGGREKSLFCLHSYRRTDTQSYDRLQTQAQIFSHMKYRISNDEWVSKEAAMCCGSITWYKQIRQASSRRRIYTQMHMYIHLHMYVSFLICIYVFRWMVYMWMVYICTSKCVQIHTHAYVYQFSSTPLSGRQQA